MSLLFLLAAKRREVLAQMPVCGVQQGQRHIVLLSLPFWGIALSVVGHAISNSAVSSLSTVGKAYRRLCARSLARA